MTIPKRDEILFPLLEYANSKKSYTLINAKIYLESYFSLSKEEKYRKSLYSDETIFRNRVGWANKYLFEAELLERVARGRYKISEDGKELLENKISSKITNNDLERSRSFREFKRRKRRNKH